MKQVLYFLSLSLLLYACKSKEAITPKVEEFVSIPDALFEQYLVDKKIDKDGLVNGRMELVNAKDVKELDLRPIYIKNLVGIEAFTDLERLSYGSEENSTVKLSSLNISKNTKLEYLWLGGVYLSKELDISQNTNLKSLSIIYSGLLNLDITKHIKLEYLRLHGNSLTNIDVSQNINLEYLACSMSRLGSLDVSKNIHLSFLSCSENQLTNLDVSKNTRLNLLACNGNKLTNLDVSQNTNLTELRCEFNKLTNLNLENNIQLEFLWCYINNLASLNLSKNIKLKELRCMDNKLLKTVCVADLSKTTNWDKDPTTTFEVCK